MPWKITCSGGNNCYVVNKDTGKRKNKKPMSKLKAKLYLKALYANTKDIKRGK
jgi:hypothetical protein